MQFCFQKHRSGTWDPKDMFSAPSGHSATASSKYVLKHYQKHINLLTDLRCRKLQTLLMLDRYYMLLVYHINTINFFFKDFDKIRFLTLFFYFTTSPDWFLNFTAVCFVFNNVIETRLVPALYGPFYVEKLEASLKKFLDPFCFACTLGPLPCLCLTSLQS